MKENVRRNIFCGAAVLLLFSSTFLPITTAYNANFLRSKMKNNQILQVNSSDDTEYYVAFGPFGANNVNDCEVAMTMNETVYQSFNNDVEEIKNQNLDSYHTIDQMLKVFINYQITPNCFTLDNLTKAIDELRALSSEKTIGVLDSNLQIGRNTIGPHMFIYCTLFDSVINFQPAGRIVLPRPYSDINKIVDIFNISKDSTLYDLLYNITVFRYLSYATINVLLGGSLGYYLSLGLFPGVPSYSIEKNPFIGVYLFCFSGGIYIFQGSDNWDEGVDNPLFDFFIGLAPFSTVTYREFSDPTP
jgi:hypothetical protein